MPKYYELMVFLRRDNECQRDDDTNFENGSELDSMALNHEIDSASETVSTAIGIIRWLLKNDETVKGKYALKKKK